MAERELVVVKLGGSLMRCGENLNRAIGWLSRVPHNVLLVPGGGEIADTVRKMDKQLLLGNERSHRLALRAMDLNAIWLKDFFLPDAGMFNVQSLCRNGCLHHFFRDRKLAIALSADFVSAQASVPFSWEFTSDSVAALIASHLNVDHLILLKSISPSRDCKTIADLSSESVVDDCFHEWFAGKHLTIINLASSKAFSTIYENRD